MKYDYKAVEAKWQKVWEDEKTFHVEIDHKKPKFYALVEFPYPSGAGLHVGHPRSYTALDVVSRKRRKNGYNVLYPMGWDAFGLPTENFAMKNHIHPAIVTKSNVDHFRSQLKALGFSFDWDREINTTDPEYYKWTQWIFLQLYKHGLAYKKEMNVNWCTGCKCVLANEEVVNGVCERCGSEVVHRVKSQWMLKITAYADKLIDGLDGLDYIERVSTQQKNWIGRSHGAEVNFGTTAGDTLTVYTTRCDTLFGATYMVISPEHALLKAWLEKGIIKNAEAVKAYQAEAARKSDFERSELNKEKTGVQLDGVMGINPVNETEIPIFISDYVLSTYGTGAIMAVPAHDTRDWEFAKKFGLPIIEVVKGNTPSNLDEAAFTDVATGTLVNSGFLNGLSVVDAKKKMITWLEENGKGRDKVNYKLRDWVFSRQRYWGEPIPMVHCDKCGWQPLPESSLPLTLPDITDFEPGPDGESPLARHKDWVKTTCPCCGGPATRETDTMPQWAGSSWYFLRYTDVHNDKELASMDALKKWAPVDLYVGGIEHAVLHLLYARFYTKFLYDIGAVPFDEPFTKLFNQGMITKNGSKMSKSLGNVVSPDELVEKYGCDSLRMYELFVGPPELDCDWDDSGIDGVFRFLNRVWKMVYANKASDKAPSKDEEYIVNKMIADVTKRVESLAMNTIVSTFMESTNKLMDVTKKEGGLSKSTLETLTVMLAPFAPHIAEEMWHELGHENTVFEAGWPEADESKLVQDSVEIALQIGGKLRGKMQVAINVSKEEAIAQAKEALASRLEGKTVVKEIYVPGKIINLIVK